MTVEDYLVLINKVIENGTYKDNWESLSNHPVPKWYSDAKFGIFIHWGVYSVPAFAYEWYPRHMYRKGSPEFEHFQNTYGDIKKVGYKDLIPMFKAEKFDAEQWLDLFEKAGAKYITPVAEHHDGFQMYSSELSRWNTVNMGPHRDVLGELKAAAEKRNITLCASSHRAEHYWFMNGGRELDCDVNDEEYEDFYGPAVLTDALKAGFPDNLYETDINSPKMREHLDNWLARTCELVDKYHPKLLYFDWWIGNHAFKPYLKKFAAYYYNRALEWGKEVTINYKHNSFAYTSAVYDIERGQLAGINPRLWQNDTAIAKNSWSYTENNDFKKTEDIICDLIDIVSKNGCLLLDVGPKADGTICEEETKVLLEIGSWMDANGEGIYGTTFWKTFGEGPTEIPEGQFSDTAREAFTSEDIRYTYKDSNLYAFVLKSPKDGVVRLKSLKYKGNHDENERILNVTVLGFNHIKATFERTKDEITVTFGKIIESKYPICIKFKLD